MSNEPVMNDSRHLAFGAVCLLFIAIGGVISHRLPAPAAEGRDRRCELPADSVRPLDLIRREDRAHLRDDAATAESWAIAYADVSPARRESAAAYAQATNDCMTTLFAQVSRVHTVAPDVVREYSRRRNGCFDAMVFLALGTTYVMAAYTMAGRIASRFPVDEWGAGAFAILALSLAAAFVAVFIGDTLSIAAEILRVGNGHLSYRADRLPWRRHHPFVFAAGVGLFWLLALLRYRDEQKTLKTRSARESALRLT
jgi:hypothetical protein